MKIAICLAYSGAHLERAECVDAIRAQIPDVQIFRSEVREPAEVWAKRLWRWGAAQDADAVVYLNDDVELCDNFVEVVKAMWQGEPLSLHTSAPDQKTRWARCYWMTGPAYVLSPAQTQSLLNHAEHAGWEKNEDNVGVRWAWVNRRPFFSPIPCPVRHISEIPSTLGYDHHPYRTTPHFQRTLSTDPEFWRIRKYEKSGREFWDAPLVQNPWFFVAAEGQELITRCAP